MATPIPSDPLAEYERVSQEAAAGVLAPQQAEFDSKLKQKEDEHQEELKQMEQERKLQWYTRLLERDLVAVVIGGILLIILTIALVAMMAFGIIDTQLLESAFLLLLGFFFGQGVAPRVGAGRTSPSGNANTSGGVT